MFPNKRYFTWYSILNPSQGTQHTDIDWVAANGWDIQLSLSVNLQTSASLHYEADVPMQRAYDAGVNVWVNISDWLTSAVGHSYTRGVYTDTTLESTYGTDWGTIIDEIEELWGPDGSQYPGVVVGYWTECGYDNAAKWLRSKTDLPIIRGIYNEQWVERGNPNAYNYIVDFDVICENVDAIDIEVWSFSTMFNTPLYHNETDCDLIGCAQYIRANYPDMPIGLDTCDRISPATNSDYDVSTNPYGSGYRWMTLYANYDTDPVTNPIPSYALCRARYQAFYTYFKNQIGAFNSICCEPQTYIESTGAPLLDNTSPTYTAYTQEAITWMEAQNLTVDDDEPNPPITSNCQVLFDFPSDASTTPVNDGLLGGVGTANVDYYFKLPTGAGCWKFGTLTTDSITFPHQTGIDDLSELSFEFGVRYGGTGGGGDGRLFSKAQTYGRFGLYIAVSGQIFIERGTTDSNYEQWATSGAACTTGNWYDIQLTWKAGTGPTNTAPVLFVNGTQYTMSRTLTGTGNWSPDAANDVYIGNRDDLARNFDGYITIARVHNAILTSQEFTINRYADKWRWQCAPATSVELSADERLLITPTETDSLVVGVTSAETLTLVITDTPTVDVLEEREPETPPYTPYTYAPVTPSDDISISPSTFIHFYNGSAVNDAIVFYAGSTACKAVILPANEELFLGPFDIDTYGSTLTITHTCAAVSQVAESGVVMAVITPPSTTVLEILGEVVTLVTTETSRASPLSQETVTLKNVETKSAIAYVGSDELVTLKIAEISQSRLPSNVITLASDETIYLDTTETNGLAVPTSSAETILLKTTELSDPNFFYAPPSWVKAHPVDYTLEVRRLNTETGGWDFLGVLDQRIAPSIQREVGLADVLSFNLLLSDPKTSLFTGPLKGLEVWYYGRDALLKQVFKVQKVEIYRDYGGSGGGSGGSTLGSGSGDGMLIVADGPESYLSEKYITYDYRAVQKRPYEIFGTLLAGIWDFGIGAGYNIMAGVDPSLDGKLIDFVASWESSKTAIDSLIQQIGGMLEVTLAPDGVKRRILLVPLPGEVIPTAIEGGGAFNVSRRFGTPEPSQDTLPVLAYNAFPPRGNAIISNNSSAQLDAHAHMNNFMTLKSGATAWDFIEGGDDRIQAAYAMEIANLSSYTIESCIYIGTQTTTGSDYDGARIFSKEQVYGAFELIYDATYQRLMYVRGTDDKNVDAWVTADNTVPENDWYYIQLTRDGTTGPDDELPPNIIVDNVVLNLTQFSVATGMWDNDFLNDLYIGNDSTLAHPFIGKLSLFRIYNYAITDSLSSFLHDGWRRDPTTAQITLDSFPTPGRMITQGAM